MCLNIKIFKSANTSNFQPLEIVGRGHLDKN